MEIFDVCDCPVMPVNRWRLPGGEWTAGVDISRWGLEGATLLAAEDAVEYNRRGCTAWVILCPECGQLYASGH